MESVSSAGDLWSFALAVYAQEGVAAACLDAQDVYGVDVCLLLCALWCARTRRALTVEQIAALDDACRDWREQVVKPLRRQRRAWREEAARAADYEALKALELNAERQQLTRLGCLCADVPGRAQRPVDALVAQNIGNLCRFSGLQAAIGAQWVAFFVPLLSG
jgi:uncharacterized protein (TIGR02444 family)